MKWYACWTRPNGPARGTLGMETRPKMVQRSSGWDVGQAGTDGRAWHANAKHGRSLVGVIVIQSLFIQYQEEFLGKSKADRVAIVQIELILFPHFQAAHG